MAEPKRMCQQGLGFSRLQERCVMRGSAASRFAVAKTIAAARLGGQLQHWLVAGRRLWRAHLPAPPHPWGVPADAHLPLGAAHRGHLGLVRAQLGALLG